MAKKIHIEITGKPIAKKRPRFFRRGNFVGTYNPQETEEGSWLLEAKGQITEGIMEGAVIMNCDFMMPMPKYLSKKKYCDLAESGMFYHTKKPDLDNLIKFVKDCLNGIAWKDDSQVVRITAKKVYSQNPGTIIELFG